MPRFFIAGTNIKGGMAVMKGRDAEHARVLRLRPGDDVILCYGYCRDNPNETVARFLGDR